MPRSERVTLIFNTKNVSIWQPVNVVANNVHNRGNNAMKQFNILVQVWFTANKAELYKLCIRVAAQVAEQLKT